MPIEINGSGSITGISAGGLPDGCIVDADINGMAASKLTGALPAISGAALTGISGGISDLSVWYLTTSFTGSADPVINWAAWNLDGNVTGFGSAMSHSNGIFTFPSTGFWEVVCQAYGYGGGGSASYSICTKISTDSGSNYEGKPRRSFSNIPALSGTWYSQNTNTMYYDVTNVSTTRVKVVVDGGPDNIDNGGTFVRFMRLADT
tara:strand:- start:65 stop:679 length:615 start_codon:yes stop_codon:yes gene_type:complete